MITLTNRDTIKPCYVDEKDIVDIKERSEDIAGRAYPYTRLHIIRSSEKHDYYIDVIESKRKIDQLIEQAN